ncbi:MAG: hypothetical protein AAGK02_02485 [Pseudomonadota bacterium]
MTDLVVGSARDQSPLTDNPYDRWIAPEGDEKALFYRTQTGFLVRFPDEVDFEIEGVGDRVTAWPVPEAKPDLAENLFNNAISPILGNHRGGLFLHGSAVEIGGNAIAFLGMSRSGKTTLAASFAKAGHPCLTEDVIELVERDGTYWLQPKPKVLRLFRDSADFLLGEQPHWEDEDEKQRVDVADALPFSDEARPLTRLFILANNEPDEVLLPHLGAQSALTELMPHSFILDVEDKARLSAHFSRLAQLAQRIPSHSLDYRREYAELPRVISAIVHSQTGTAPTHETE